MSEATPPGPARKWTDMLPSPWDEDPEVVAVLLPPEVKLEIRVMKDSSDEREFLVGHVEIGTQHMMAGLQIVSPPLDTYSEHSMMFRQLGLRMAHPAHIGKLSSIPQKFLLTSDFKALVFNKDHMSHEFLDLRKEGKKLATLTEYIH